MRIALLAAAAAVSLSTIPALAQEAVTGAADPEALFTSPDPQLHANKQVAYRVIRDLLEANHWELADELIAEDYVQHNPNAASGRDAVVTYFTEVLKVEPTPIPETLQRMKIVSVTAEDDLVVVAYVREAEDPQDPEKTYTTTWFDMWRVKDGKIVEHWDPALIGEAPDILFDE